MAQLQLKKAQRTKAYLKLGLSAPSGGGKTLGALLIGYGLMKKKYPQLSDGERWEKIAIIDSENGSGELYVGKSLSNVSIGEYLAVTLEPPFEPQKYIDALDLCHANGVEVVIIDSTTHLWSGEGGLLQKQNDAVKRTGNSYAAWRDVTPLHNRFIDAMLQTPVHIIATMRSKTDYVQEKNDEGKTVVRKVGLAPVQRDGFEYEFTLFLDIANDHTATASKDRTSLYDGKSFLITPKVGETLMEWLESGTDAPKAVVAETTQPISEMKSIAEEMYNDADETTQAKYMELFKSYEPTGNPKKIKDPIQFKKLLSDMEKI